MAERSAWPYRTLVLACSGAANAGQIANQAAMELDRSGAGRMGSAAAIAAGIEGQVRGARAVEQVIVLDGCSTGCARLGLLRATGREPDTYVVVTKLGVTKTHKFDFTAAEVARTVAATRQAAGLPCDGTHADVR